MCPYMPHIHEQLLVACMILYHMSHICPYMSHICPYMSHMCPYMPHIHEQLLVACMILYLLYHTPFTLYFTTHTYMNSCGIAVSRHRTARPVHDPLSAIRQTCSPNAQGQSCSPRGLKFFDFFFSLTYIYMYVYIYIYIYIYMHVCIYDKLVLPTLKDNPVRHAV